MLLKTKIDQLTDIIKKSEKKINFQAVAKQLGWNEGTVEKIILILEKAGLAETHYPADMIRKPWATIKEVEMPKPKELKEEGKLVEEYDTKLKIDHMFGKVRITYSKDERRPVYNITLPQVSPYVRAYLEYVKIESSKRISLASLNTP